MTQEPRTRVRRRQIIVGAADGPQDTATTLAQEVQEVFRLQSVAADAADAAKRAAADLDARMKRENVTEVIVPMRGNTPAILADYKQSAASSTIDPEKFFKLVTREQFFECVTVGKGKAEKIVAATPLKKITKFGEPGKKTLNVRTLPKNHVTK